MKIVALLLFICILIYRIFLVLLLLNFYLNIFYHNLFGTNQVLFNYFEFISIYFLLYHNQVKLNDFHHKDANKLSIKVFLILKELLDS